MLKIENIKKIEGATFYNDRFILSGVDEFPTKIHFNFTDRDTPVIQTIQLDRESILDNFELKSLHTGEVKKVYINALKNLGVFVFSLHDLIDPSPTW